MGVREVLSQDKIDYSTVEHQYRRAPSPVQRRGIGDSSRGCSPSPPAEHGMVVPSSSCAHPVAIHRHDLCRSLVGVVGWDREAARRSRIRGRLYSTQRDSIHLRGLQVSGGNGETLSTANSRLKPATAICFYSLRLGLSTDRFVCSNLRYRT